MIASGHCVPRLDESGKAVSSAHLPGAGHSCGPRFLALSRDTIGCRGPRSHQAHTGGSLLPALLTAGPAGLWCRGGGPGKCAGRRGLKEVCVEYLEVL